MPDETPDERPGFAVRYGFGVRNEAILIHVHDRDDETADGNIRVQWNDEGEAEVHRLRATPEGELRWVQMKEAD